MIDVFNRLTDQQLADCQLFEDMILIHYEKFKYFYYIIEDMDLKTVQEIHCQEKDNELIMFINFKNKKDSTSFKNNIVKYISNFTTPYDTIFNMIINEVKNKLNISIEGKNCREEMK